MSLEIRRYGKRKRLQAPAPLAPQRAPSAPLEAFAGFHERRPKCRWPHGCTNQANIWHAYYYCERHAAEERLAREGPPSSGGAA